MARFGAALVVAVSANDHVSLLQMGVSKHTVGCGEVPTICPEEGEGGTDECPDGCKYIEDCDMCQKAAKFWKRKYGGANNWPENPRPHGCFRNRKWKIKCNSRGNYGGYKGKWPVCQQICGHAKWVGTEWEKSCVKACPTTTTTTTDPEPSFASCENANECPEGENPVTDYYACKKLAQTQEIKYPGQMNGRWSKRSEGHGDNSKFPFMPPGCVLYTGWKSGQHEAHVTWNADPAGKNDGNRCVICVKGPEPTCPEWPAPSCSRLGPTLPASAFKILPGESACPAGYKHPDYRTCKDHAEIFQAGNVKGKWNEGERYGSYSQFPYMPPGCTMNYLVKPGEVYYNSDTKEITDQYVAPYGPSKPCSTCKDTARNRAIVCQKE